MVFFLANLPKGFVLLLVRGVMETENILTPLFQIITPNIARVRKINIFLFQQPEILKQIA